MTDARPNSAGPTGRAYRPGAVTECHQESAAGGTRNSAPGDHTRQNSAQLHYAATSGRSSTDTRSRRPLGEVRVDPGADDSGSSFGLIPSGEEVVGALEGHETTRVSRRPEDHAGVRDTHCVVGG
jgi:hypothetical protein